MSYDHVSVYRYQPRTLVFSSNDSNREASFDAQYLVGYEVDRTWAVLPVEQCRFVFYFAHVAEPIEVIRACGTDSSWIGLVVKRLDGLLGLSKNLLDENTEPF